MRSPSCAFVKQILSLGSTVQVGPIAAEFLWREGQVHADRKGAPENGRRETRSIIKTKTYLCRRVTVFQAIPGRSISAVCLGVQLFL